MEESDIEYDWQTLNILGEQFDLQCIANDSLSLEALYDLASTRSDISGRKIWEGGLLLAKYVLGHGKSLFLRKTVLELGAGTGIASRCAISAGAEVVVTTDGDSSCVPLLKDNLDSAKINGSVGLAMSLKWGDKVQMQELANVCEENGWRTKLMHSLYSCIIPHVSLIRCPPFDVILAADVLYKSDLVDPFLDSVLQCLSKTGLLVLCHIPRVGVKHSDLDAALTKRGFEITLTEFPTMEGILASGETMNKNDASRARIYLVKRHGHSMVNNASAGY